MNTKQIFKKHEELCDSMHEYEKAIKCITNALILGYTKEEIESDESILLTCSKVVKTLYKDYKEIRTEVLNFQEINWTEALNVKELLSLPKLVAIALLNDYKVDIDENMSIAKQLIIIENQLRETGEISDFNESIKEINING